MKIWIIWYDNDYFEYCSSIEYTKINFNFQYLKYESDEGLLFQDSRTLWNVIF